MNRTLIKSTLVVAVISALSGSAYARTSSAPTSTTSNVATSLTKVHGEQSWRDLDEPRVQLNRAQLNLGKKNYKVAAGDLRQAAAAVDRQAERAHGKSYRALVRDAAALRATAAEVEAGRITEANALDRQLTTVRADLARHQYLAAAEAWRKKENAAAGRSLAAAARYLETGFALLGQKSSAELKSAEAAAVRLSQKGANAAESEYRHARDVVGRALERLRGDGQAKTASWPAQSPFDQGA